MTEEKVETKQRKPLSPIISTPCGAKELHEYTVIWQNNFESMLLQMSDITNDQHILLHVDTKPLLNEYNKLITQIEHTMKNGVFGVRHD